MPLDLPPGFRFMPRNEELIKYYLRNKVLGKQLPADVVTEGEVYGDDAQLPEADIGDMKLYLFVKPEPKRNGRTNRKTRNGHWKVTGHKKEITDKKTNHKIGTMTCLVLVDNSNSGRRQKLLMDEYKLDGSLIQNNSEQEWVLCKIKQSNRSPEEGCIQQRPSEYDEELSHLRLDQPLNQSCEIESTPTSRPTALPALHGNIDNINGSLVINVEDSYSTDDVFRWIGDPMEQCPVETPGGPNHLWPDQSLGIDYDCYCSDIYDGSDFM